MRPIILGVLVFFLLMFTAKSTSAGGPELPEELNAQFTSGSTLGGYLPDDGVYEFVHLLGQDTTEIGNGELKIKTMCNSRGTWGVFYKRTLEEIQAGVPAIPAKFDFGTMGIRTGSALLSTNEFSLSFGRGEAFTMRPSPKDPNVEGSIDNTIIGFHGKEKEVSGIHARVFEVVFQNGHQKLSTAQGGTLIETFDAVNGEASNVVLAACGGRSNQTSAIIDFLVITPEADAGLSAPPLPCAVIGDPNCPVVDPEAPPTIEPIPDLPPVVDPPEAPKGKRGQFQDRVSELEFQVAQQGRIIQQMHTILARHQDALIRQDARLLALEQWRVLIQSTVDAVQFILTGFFNSFNGVSLLEETDPPANPTPPVDNT